MHGGNHDGRGTPRAVNALIRRGLIALCMLAPACASAQMPSAERGRALYENHCIVCHTGRVHSRINRLAVSRAEVREIVSNWQVQQKLGWNAADVEDVVEYLNRTRYHFQ